VPNFKNTVRHVVVALYRNTFVTWSLHCTETRSLRGAPASWSVVMSVTRLPDSEIELTIPTIRTGTRSRSHDDDKVFADLPGRGRS
jgi:hypothetical protein